MSVIDQIKAILGPAVDLLTNDDIASVLPNAVIPDSDGRLPGTAGWVPTHDAYWAAADAALLLHTRSLGQKTITQVDSEGAKFTWQPADFAVMAQTIRRRSPLYKGGGLGSITVPSHGSGWSPTSRGWPWS